MQRAKEMNELLFFTFQRYHKNTPRCFLYIIHNVVASKSRA